MKLLKNCVLIVSITIALFLACDFTLSRLGVTPEYFAHKNRRFNMDDPSRGVAHPVYHHDLKQNLNIIDAWGPIKYQLCTNEFGFKVSCSKEKESRKNFDVAFIGDSFTEAIGVPYEESFVGLYAQKHPGIAVANFGVSSYSASIFFKKIEFLLNNGFMFKHLVVLPDISDVRDEAVWYAFDEKTGAIIDNPERASIEAYNKSSEEHDKGKKVENSFHRMLMRHFQYTWHINCLIYDYFDDDGTGEKSVSKQHEFPLSKWTQDIDSPHFGKEGVPGGIQKNLKYMRKLKQLLDTHKIKMTLVVYPWPTQVFFDKELHLGVQIWKNFCIEEACDAFIDANPFFFDEARKTSKKDVIKKYYIHGDVHFNKEGNKAMFEIIDSRFKP